jgi:hypothetical protein
MWLWAIPVRGDVLPATIEPDAIGIWHKCRHQLRHLLLLPLYLLSLAVQSLCRRIWVWRIRYEVLYALESPKQTQA